jgi:hypothetical protein
MLRPLVLSVLPLIRAISPDMNLPEQAPPIPDPGGLRHDHRLFGRGVQRRSILWSGRVCGFQAMSRITTPIAVNATLTR